jgi:hypothetical protein
MKKIKNATGMYRITENNVFDRSTKNMEKTQNISAYASMETLQYNNHVKISKNTLSSDIFLFTNHSMYTTKLKRLIKTINKVNLTISKTVNTIDIIIRLLKYLFRW